MTLTRLTILLALLCIVAVPSLSSAQEKDSVKEAIGTGLLRTMYLMTPLVHAADGISTMRVLDLGGREMNPILSPQVNNRTAFTATKAGIVVAEVYLAHRMASHHKFGAIAALAAMNFGYAMVAAHNFRVARTMQGQMLAIP